MPLPHTGKMPENHANKKKDPMTTSSEIVHCYTQLAARVERMAELARPMQWDQLPQLEIQCASIVERLRGLKPQETLASEQMAHTRELIQRIQADQAEVVRLVGPQVKELLARMSSMYLQQNLDRAYGPAH